MRDFRERIAGVPALNLKKTLRLRGGEIASRALPDPNRAAASGLSTGRWGVGCWTDCWPAERTQAAVASRQTVPCQPVLGKCKLVPNLGISKPAPVVFSVVVSIFREDNVGAVSPTSRSFIGWRGLATGRSTTR